MAVVPEARGRGVGKWLMAQLIAEAKARGERVMVLEVIEQNEPAVRLYKGCGFHTQRRLVSYALAQAEEMAEVEPEEVDPRELGRSYPVAAAMQGDAKPALKRLLEASSERTDHSTWVERVQELVGGWRAEVAALMEEIREALAGKARDREVTLEIDIASGAGSLQGDANAIRAMLVNVLENSVEACGAVHDKAKRAGRVVARVVRESPWIIFDIRDNGIGMDRETQEKIFSLFFSSKGIKGTGLGLFIANKIVDKHGGDIEVESEPGRGSRFVIRLPVDARPSTKPRE